MSEWKNRIKGHILLLIVISFLFACAKKSDVIAPSGAASMSVDYFIIKEPEPNDKAKLRNVINRGDNPEIRNKAQILLGGYFYKKGAYESSLNDLENAVSTDNKELNNAANIWKASLYKFFGKMDSMGEALSSINQTGKISSYLFSKTCEKGEAFCIKSEDIVKHKKKIKPLPKTEGEKTVDKGKEKSLSKEEKLNKNKLKIYAADGNFEDSAFKGMLLAASEDNRTEILSSDNLSANNNAIDVSKLEVKTAEGETSFKMNYKKAIDSLLYDTDLSKCEEIVVGVNDRFVHAGEYTVKQLQKSYSNITMNNYETKSFKNLYKKPDNETITTRCFIGIGREKSMTNFVPLVRFVSPDREGTETYIVTDVYTGVYKDKNFIDYFGDVNIYTYIDTIYDTKSKYFMSSFEETYGTKPSYEAFIGYDMVKYLRGKAFGNDNISYASSINNVYPPVAQRYVNKIRIDDHFKARFLFKPEGEQIPLLSIPAE